MPNFISSNLSRITPDPYKKGTLSNNIWIANQLVMLPDKAKTPTRRMKERSSRYKKPIKIIKIDTKFVIKDLFIINLF
jgi:hypothetical protein